MIDLGSWAERLATAFPSPLTVDGLVLYGLLGVLLLALAAKHRQRDGDSRDTATTDPGRGSPTGTGDVDQLSERQQRVVVPDGVEWDTRSARGGEQWLSALHVTGFPDYPTDGALAGLFETTTVDFDLTYHVSPRDQERARADLERYADELQADADLERTSRHEYLQQRAAEARAMQTAVEEGENVFDQSLFVTLRGQGRDAIEAARREVVATLRDDPAQLDARTTVCKQDLALRSAAPVGGDALGRQHVALGGAVGAFLASPHDPTVLEPDGVEIGVHRETGTPLVVDPFAREDGYAQVVVGDPGSGKSFASKLNFLRSIEQREDRIGVVLEPLGNWAGVAAALDAERVTVGGEKTINPLEIRQPPEEVYRTWGEDARPLSARIDRAMSFFTNFFAAREVELGDRRATLEWALRVAYGAVGITEDVDTHDRESPTMDTVLRVLEEMDERPEKFVVRSERETEKIREDAIWLLNQFHPFVEGGQFAHLDGQSEVDLRDEDVVYLDLGLREGTVTGDTALLMELLISLVYERAKATSKEVVFYIDEARYVMQDASTLQFLETIFRHHRHHDLSIRLVTQTVDEFLDSDVAEIILDQCTVTQFHKLDGMDDEIAAKFGLNEPQQRFVSTAMPGDDERGYSEALVGVDGEWRGIEVRALPKEQQVIDFDPTG